MTELSFVKAPEIENSYKVGDKVEVYCDHENEKGDRVSDWQGGVVVQVDPKTVAIQFRETVYLTNGWMIPDHVLWCPPNSEKIRPALKRKRRPRN